MARLGPRGNQVSFVSSLCLVALAGALGGCREKMRAEQRAEDLAKEKAAASASAAAAASIPDPREERYAAARKAVRDRAVAHLTALQKIYEGVSEAERVAFRDWFAPTKEGEKEADELSKEAAFAGKAGMTIRRFEVHDVNFDPAVTLGTVDAWIEESQRGKARCTIYKLDFREVGGTWRRVARRDFRIVPCE
jgi:hypothetical protein